MLFHYVANYKKILERQGNGMLSHKPKNRMSVKQFRIGDLAHELKIKKFVIRFWEKEFNLIAHRSDGGQRFYDQDDFEIFKRIKKLLYEEGFTIPGARKQLELERRQLKLSETALPCQPTISPEQFFGAHKDQLANSLLHQELQTLKKDLKKLRTLLQPLCQK